MEFKIYLVLILHFVKAIIVHYFPITISKDSIVSPMFEDQTVDKEYFLPQTLLYIYSPSGIKVNSSIVLPYNDVSIDKKSFLHFETINGVKQNFSIPNVFPDSSINSFEINNGYTNSFLLFSENKTFDIRRYGNDESSGLQSGEIDQYPNINCNSYIVLDEFFICVVTENNSKLNLIAPKLNNLSEVIDNCNKYQILGGASYDSSKTAKYILCNESDTNNDSNKYVIYKITADGKEKFSISKTTVNFNFEIIKGVVITNDYFIITALIDNHISFVSLKYSNNNNLYNPFHMMNMYMNNETFHNEFKHFYYLSYTDSTSLIQYITMIAAYTNDTNIYIPCLFMNSYFKDKLNCSLSCPQDSNYISDVNFCNNCTNNENETFLNVTFPNKENFPYYASEFKCVESCQDDEIYDENNKMCLKCYKNAFIDKDNQQCVDHCDINDKGIIVNWNQRYCMNCRKHYLKYHYGIEEDTCVQECESWEASRNDSCYLCSQKGLKFDNEKCVENCPELYSSENSSASICSKCTDGYNYVEGKCLQSCVEGYKDGKNCYPCSNRGQYLNTSEKANNYCIDTCNDSNFLGDYGKCGTCPLNYKSFQYVCIPNDTNNTSGSSGNDTLYEYFNVTCWEYNKYSFQKTCVNECPIKTEIKGTQCENCSNFYDKGTCENSCTKFTFNDTNTICIYCSDTNQYLMIEDINKTCVSSCPNNTEQNEFYYVCNYCKKNGQYLYNGFCVDKCPKYSIWDDENICQLCRENYEFFYNNTCVEKCPPNIYTDYLKGACFEEETKTFCQLNGVYNNTSEICDCNDGYFGTYCQYTLEEMQLVIKEYEDKLILKEVITIDTLDLIVNDNYIKIMKIYIGICFDIPIAYSDKIFDDLYVRLSYAVGYGKSNLRKTVIYDFYLFDFYFSFLSIKYRLAIDTYKKDKRSFFDENEYPQDIDDPDNNQEIIKDSNRKKVINIRFNYYSLIDDDISNYDENRILNDIMGVFTTGRKLLNHYIKHLITLEKYSAFYMKDFQNFQINILPFYDYIYYSEENADSLSLVNTSSILNNTEEYKLNLVSYPHTLVNESLNYYNISNCENSLNSLYHFSINDSLLSYTVIYNSTMNFDYVGGNSLTNSLYATLGHPSLSSFSPVSICQPEKIFYSLKLNVDQKKESLVLYSQKLYEEEKIDVMSAKEEFFTSRCYKYKTNDTYPLYTLSQRINLYFINKVVKCISYKNYSNYNCESSAINNDKYITCECEGLGEVKVGLVTIEKPEISKYTFNIIKCIFLKGSKIQYWINIGFFIGAGLPCLFFILFLITRTNLKSFYSHNTERIIYNDCLTLNYFQTRNSFLNFNKGKLKRNNNVNFFQHQYESVLEEKIINKVEKDSISDDTSNKGEAQLKKQNAEFKRRKKRNKEILDKYFVFGNNKQSTLNDIESLDITTRIQYKVDKRTIVHYFIDFTLNTNIILNTFIKKSIITPKSVRIVILYLYIAFTLFFSMLFYHEDVIALQPEETNKILVFKFIISNDKAFYSLIATYLCVHFFILLFKFLVKVNQKTLDQMNVVLITLDENIIDHAIEMLYDNMFFKYLILYIICLMITGINLLYFISFCKIYAQCILGWTITALYIFIFDIFGIDLFILPFFASICWSISDKCGLVGRCLVFGFEALKMSNKPGVFTLNYEPIQQGENDVNRSEKKEKEEIIENIEEEDKKEEEKDDDKEKELIDKNGEKRQEIVFE